MDLIERINRDLVETMKSKEADRDLVLSVLRMAKSALKNAEIAKRGSGEGLDEEDVIGVLTSMVKQRKESVEQYRKAERKDLAEKEEREIGIIQRYLPQQLGAGELDEIIAAAVAETGVTDIKEIGKLMKALMPRVRGKADGKVVNQRVREILEKKQG